MQSATCMWADVQAIVDVVNRLGADAVAITGDPVDGPVGQLDPWQVHR